MNPDGSRDVHRKDVTAPSVDLSTAVTFALGSPTAAEGDITVAQVSWRKYD